MDSPLAAEKAALTRAAKVLGGQAALAAAIGFSDRRHVWPWFNTDRRIPAEHCPAIERATRAAGEPVTCEELRPDVAWGVLREQVAAAEPTATTGKPKGEHAIAAEPGPHPVQAQYDRIISGIESGIARIGSLDKPDNKREGQKYDWDRAAANHRESRGG